MMFLWCPVRVFGVRRTENGERSVSSSGRERFQVSESPWGNKSIRYLNSHYADVAWRQVRRPGGWQVGSSVTPAEAYTRRTRPRRRRNAKEREKKRKPGGKGKSVPQPCCSWNWANASEFQNSYRPEFSFNNQVIIHRVHLLPSFCPIPPFPPFESCLAHTNGQHSFDSWRIEFSSLRGKREIAFEPEKNIRRIFTRGYSDRRSLVKYHIESSNERLYFRSYRVSCLALADRKLFTAKLFFSSYTIHHDISLYVAIKSRTGTFVYTFIRDNEHARWGNRKTTG